MVKQEINQYAFDANEFKGIRNSLYYNMKLYKMTPIKLEN